MIEISAGLVRRLIADQLPQWSDLPVEPVAQQGWDNRTFRLGGELSVRLPSARGYAAAIAKEDRWLPALAGRLPVAVPVPVATGRPGSGYPFAWSVRRWLPGETLQFAPPADRNAFARDLGEALVALRAVPAGGGPGAGSQSAFRGCHPGVYGDDVKRALGSLASDVDASACWEVWRQATACEWESEPVWFHGDVAVGNLLTRDGRLSALIDFGACGTGDPACDLVMAWTYFSAAERRIFRQSAGLDDGAWRRARGWALWKALITLASGAETTRDGVQHRTVSRVLADPVV